MALNKTVHFETLGCRLNQLESEGAAEFFIKAGWSVQMKAVLAKDKDDDSVCLCVLNTCAVTGKAEQKARRTINLLLKKFPFAALVVTGCFAQLSPKEIQGMDGRLAVLPGKAKSALAKVPEFLEKSDAKDGNEAALLLRNFFGPQKVGGDFSGHFERAQEPFLLLPKSFAAHSRASLKIQDGCDNNCSYCAIHFARGKSVSIPPALALERALDLEKSGQAELVLTGVNIGQYKGEWQGRALDAAGLLRLILQNTKKIAIRFSSVYPQTVTEDFCEAIKDRRVRPHFHISVQSGSDCVLKRMRRAYDRKMVLEACLRLRKAKENPFLACDIITGFPGESEADFADTLSLLKEGGFAKAHAFPFSPRPGTDAASYAPKIPERIKGERVAALNELSAVSKLSYIQSFAGKTLDAVAESVRNPPKDIPKGKVLVRAVTENFIHAEILLNESDIVPPSGGAVRVKILGAKKEAVARGEEWEALAQLL